METKMMTITPAMARIMLNNNNNNRSISKATVAQYATDMMNGKWKNTHQGIAIYRNGDLADGQHRLKAILLSGSTISMLVTTGLDKDDSDGIDANRPRTLLNRLQIGGNNDLNTKTLSVLKFLITDASSTSVLKVTPSIINSILNDKLLDAINFSYDKFSGTGSVAPLTSSLRSALTLAYYYEDRERLSEFKKVYKTGIISNINDVPAIKLRDHLMTKTKVTGHKTSTEIFRKSQKIIHAFCNLYPIKSVRLPISNIYNNPLTDNELIKNMRT